MKESKENRIKANEKFKDLETKEVNGLKFKEMRQKDIRELRKILWERNQRKCPVLGIDIPFDKTSLDHAHKTIAEEYSPNKGTIREALDFRANAILGKLENSIKRTGLHNLEEFNLPDFLRNAADYFERGSVQDSDGYYFIHPSEVPKEPNISKRNYNRLKKLYSESGRKAKFPEYPKSKKLTIPLKKLFEEFNIDPYN